jgi:hypothetical protein
MIGNKYLLAAILASSPLAAQATEDVRTFESITGIEHTSRQILLTGVLVNDSTPTTLAVEWPSFQGVPHTRCEALFNLVLSQPAELRLVVVTEVVNVVENGVPLQLNVLRRCASQVTP